MKKKIMSLFLALTLCWSLSVPAFASVATQQPSSGVDYVDITEVSPLTSDEIEEYSQYTFDAVQVLSVSMAQDLLKNDILSMSTLIDTKDISNSRMNLYTSSELPLHLYACRDVTEILEVGGSVYITYQTSDDKTVYLTFSNEGLVGQIVYDPSNDTVYILSPKENTKIANFRYGSTESISSELQNTIRECIVSGDYSEIQNNPALSVEIDELGHVVIEPNTTALTRSGVMGFTNEADLLRNLKADFPMMNNERDQNAPTSAYCEYLKKYIGFRGLNYRGDYVRVTADSKTFWAGALITGIGAYLDIKIAGVLTLLDLLGIGVTIISGEQVLADTVKLYRSANYEYYYTRYGLLEDSTRFNDYVVVESYSGFGTFCGGYDVDDEFVWIRNPSSDPETRDWNTIQRACVTRYNADLTEFGYCERYFPLGWFDY